MKSIVIVICFIVFSQAIYADLCSIDNEFKIEKLENSFILSQHNLFNASPIHLSKANESFYYSYSYSFVEFRLTDGFEQGILTSGEMNPYGEPVYDSLRDDELRSEYCQL